MMSRILGSTSQFRRHGFVLAVTLLYLHSTSNNSIALAQDCGEILRAGIYDIRSTTVDVERAASFVHWFREHKFSSYQEAKNFGLNIGIPIDGILVGLGLTADDKGFSTFQQNIEEYDKSSTSFKMKIEEFTKTINPDVVKAWEHCINSNGLHFWIEQYSNPGLFSIKARYISSGPGPEPQLQSIQFVPSSAVKVGAGAFFDASGKTIPLKLDGSTKTQAFERIKSDAVRIIVNATNGEGLDVELRDLRPVPKVLNFTATPASIMEGGSSKLSWLVVHAEKVFIDNGVGEQPLVGSIDVKPSTSTTYTLKAFSELGADVGTVGVQVQTKPPTLVRADVTFVTKDDDKDAESFGEVFIKNRAGVDVAYTSFKGTKFGDKPPSTNVVSATPVQGVTCKPEDVTDGILTTKLFGGDDWGNTCHVTLYFSDNSVYESPELEYKMIESDNNKSSGDINRAFKVVLKSVPSFMTH